MLQTTAGKNLTRFQKYSRPAYNSTYHILTMQTFPWDLWHFPCHVFCNLKSEGHSSKRWSDWQKNNLSNILWYMDPTSHLYWHLPHPLNVKDNIYHFWHSQSSFHLNFTFEFFSSMAHWKACLRVLNVVIGKWQKDI